MINEQVFSFLALYSANVKNFQEDYIKKVFVFSSFAKQTQIYSWGNFHLVVKRWPNYFRQMGWKCVIVSHMV